MLTKGGVKLLDFGLAKTLVPQAERAGLTSLPTMASPQHLTQQGTILGTFQYMAPEQLEGNEADARSDIFAFGAVLYEMATGKRAFDGKSQASLIGSILRDQPPPASSIAPMTPPALDRVIATCLAKDPDDRFQTAHDVRLQLQWITEGGSQAGVPAPVAHRRKSRERLAWTIAAAALVLAAGAHGYRRADRPQEREARPVIAAAPRRNELLAGGERPGPRRGLPGRPAGGIHGCRRQRQGQRSTCAPSTPSRPACSRVRKGRCTPSGRRTAAHSASSRPGS